MFCLYSVSFYPVRYFLPHLRTTGIWIVSILLDMPGVCVIHCSAHGTNGRTFLVEFDKDRVQFRDENQTIINLGDVEHPIATYAREKFMWYPKILKEFMFLMKRKVSLHIRIEGSGDGQFKNPYGCFRL